MYFGGGLLGFFSGKAPLTFVSADQINAIVPYSVAGNPTVPFSIDGDNGYFGFGVVPVARTSVGIFTQSGSGKGAAIVLNQNGTTNSGGNPAPRGSIVTFYASGYGQTDPAGVDGKPACAPLPKPLASSSVTIGGINAEVLYAGAAPGMIGVMQVNARIPLNVVPGNAISIFLTVGSTSQQGVTIAVN